jgi:hypothetical protein
MRIAIIPLTFALAMSAATAFAADQTTGIVKNFDIKAMTLTLEDGTTFTLPKGFVDPGLKDGGQVRVDWKMVGSKHAAETVEIMR